MSYFDEEYPTEQEYAHHITNQIVEYFRKRGFRVRAIPISPHKEKTEGYDWRYELRDLKKVFMLQFKRPTPRDANISWELKENQHNLLMEKNYIFYCLPKSKNREEMEVMLYRCLFKRATFPFTSNLKPQFLKYCDGWGSFASNVLRCTYGLRLENNELFDEKIDFEESIALLGLDIIEKRAKIFANEKILKDIVKFD